MNLPSGKQIRAARNLLNLSATDLANRVGANAHQVYRVERKRAPALAVRLCAELESLGARFVGGGVVIQVADNDRRP
jgi:hypothetical protein